MKNTKTECLGKFFLVLSIRISNLITIVFFILVGLTGFSQSYIDDAKNLAKFSELHSMDVNSLLDNSDNNEDFLRQILIQKRSVGFDTNGSQGNNSNTSGANSGIFDDDSVNDETSNASQIQQATNGFDEIAIERLKIELEVYKKLVVFDQSYIQDTHFDSSINSIPDSFEYLIPTIQVLEQNISAGNGTSGGVLGSLVGVSQSEILQGITDWALNRAQEELMQAFLREWLERLQNDELLKETFPNSLNMLSTSDLSAIFTDGETWKATFKQDLDAIPDNIPKIAELVITKLNITIPENSKAELISGLTAITTVFKEIGKSKKIDEVLMLLGEETFINNTLNKCNYKTIINRSLVGINVFLSSIQNIDGGETKYTLSSELLKLDDLELKMLWKLIYSRERDKLKFAFNLTNDNEVDFYNNVNSNIQNLKLQLTKVAETINGINTILTKVSELEDKKFSIEQFNTYTLLVFDLIENGINGISLLTNVDGEKNKIKEYKEKYIEGFKYVSLLHEGIKTKAYGMVALNTLNLITWLKNYVNGEGNRLTIDSELFAKNTIERLINETITDKGAITKILDAAQNIINKKLADYEKTKALVQGKFDILRTNILKDDFVITKPNIQALLNNYTSYQDEDLRVITKEFAEIGLLNFQSSSAALNKYTKLMASVILAEDSNDIKEALDAVAMKTGSYLVKQQSYFSATVSFYPGIEYGWERIEGKNGLSDTDGSYLGASLPIGIEFAAGTNWKPIGSIGLFVQLLDLGAVLNYSLSNDNSDVSSNPEFGFEQVFSPGAYLTLHLSNNPITLGAGASYSPSLREISSSGVTTQANALQVGVFVAVDLNVFTIYASRKKIALKSKSKETAYEN